MLLSIGAILLGLVLLVWSADRFVEGASATAGHLGVSSLVIGITIIGFGTSAPEILISLIAVMQDTPDLAIGNALGSNIANIGLILGVTALLLPLPIASNILKREFPLLILASALLVYALWDSQLDRVDGVLLLTLLFLVLWYILRSSRNQKDDPLVVEIEAEISHQMSLKTGLIWLLIGLLILVISSKILVWGAVNIATALGISELVIGLTIVALGTSLPELAAAIASARKGEPDLAIGNVIGSNLFNSLAVIGIPALLIDFSVNTSAVTRDLPAVIIITLLLFLLAKFSLSGKQGLSRRKGLLLLSSFVFYQGYLYYQVTNVV